MRIDTVERSQGLGILALISFCCGILAATPTGSLAGDSAPAKYRSPFAVSFSPDGKRLAVSDSTAPSVAIFDVPGGKLAGEVTLQGSPRGVVWSADGSRLFVAEYGAGTVAEVDPSQGKVTRRLEVGLRPAGLALARGASILLACNFDSDSVSLLSLGDGKARTRIAVVRQPMYVVLSPDESLAIVTNSLPDGRASDPEMAGCVSLIDLKKTEKVADVKLPPGSSNLRGVAVSPDGRWAYVVHTVGRTQVPTTQLDRGWVNTNGLSVIDLPSRQVLATVLLDHPMEGAADPWAVALSKDGARLFVTLSGTHQAARIELAQLHRFLDGKLPDDHRLAQTASYSPGTESIWLRIKRDLKERAELVNDLSSLYAADLIQRMPLGGKGPRGADLSPDGSTLAVGLYFSGSVALLDPATGKSKGTFSLGPSAEPDEVRRGEILFHDATYCFQHWMSCATCHESGRVDGMNWDLLNDGIGNPKSSRSLVWSHKTPPMMSLGVRDTVEEAIKAGFIHIQFHEPEETTLRAVQAYVQSLEPEPSPRLLPGGQLSEAAKRGEAVFQSEETGCAKCHPAPLYTDLKAYDVGTKGELDRTSEFDTPTLIELHRTRPFLHDGSAATLREALIDRNTDGKHGKTTQLGPQQIDDLIEFLLSL